MEALIDGYCYHTPESMELKIYEFGICTGAVSPSTKPDKCSTLFKDSSGKTVNLAVGDSLPLSDGVTLDEGTYTHGYLLVGNVFKTKAIIEFTTDRTDDRWRGWVGYATLMVGVLTITFQ